MLHHMDVILNVTNIIFCKNCALFLLPLCCLSLFTLKEETKPLNNSHRLAAFSSKGKGEKNLIAWPKKIGPLHFGS